MKIIISGGGTGGHVYPALAIARELKVRGVEDILFVGAEGKLEMEKVPQAGFPIEGLRISGFHRTRKWRNILFPFKLLNSLWKAKKIIDKFVPDVVVGVGGYASGPVLKIAQLKRIPTVIQEQNSYPGVTNKLLAKRANKILVAYDGLARFFDEDRLLLCGNPVRKDLLQLDQLKQDALGFFGLDLNKKTILIFGGSLGAKRINEAVLYQKELLMVRNDVQVIWQVGKIYYDQYKDSELAQQAQIIILPFIDRMDLAYSAADVVIGRAGALTISELMIVGKPTVLVPSPNVAEDHQTKNAQALVKENAAILIPDEAAAERMVPTAIELLEDHDLRILLSKNIRHLARPEATDLIVDEILALV